MYIVHLDQINSNVVSPFNKCFQLDTCPDLFIVRFLFKYHPNCIVPFHGENSKFNFNSHSRIGNNDLHVQVYILVGEKW